ncbi:putative F-box protein [Tanacetum coccineum]|uniref:F-box protein n=1 Tax=Tanacetum coccineum TaxID=301880 RepID=A0ABQ5CD94_9ASTR
MKPKPKRSTLEVHVPDDVILNHILARVPTKSVCRFNCVSKEWHSFLASDMFKNKHNQHVDDHKNNLKFMFLSKTETSFEFATIDCEEAPPSDKDLTPTRRPLPPFEETTPYDIHILTSFHGLVCLGILKDWRDVEYSDLILWNPLTNEYKRLSKSKYQHRDCITLYWKFGLYYSCCEDYYKLLCLNLFDDYVYIYSLKSDSWRKVDAFQHISRLFIERWSQGTYLNENLYFLRQDINNQSSSIIRFDTKNERLSKIETPCVDANNQDAKFYFATIMVKSDCIHVCVKYDINMSCDKSFQRTTCIELWKLDEYGKMKQVLTYQLRPLLYDHNTISSLIPFHLMKNGNWLMLKNGSSFSNDRIYKVYLKKKMHITNKGKEKEKGNIYDDFEYANVRMDDNININNLAREVRYIETFVSPNRYMK